MEKCTILVNSCDKYEDAWYPLFKIMKAEWKDRKWPIVLNTESKTFDYEDMRNEMKKSRHVVGARHRSVEIDFSKQIDFCKKHVEFLKSVQDKDISIFKKVTFDFSYDTSGKIMEKSRNDFKRVYGTTAVFISELNLYFNSMEKDMTTVSKAVNSFDINKLVKEDKLQTGEAEKIFKETKELFKITFEASQLIMKVFKNSLRDIKRATDKINEIYQ